MIILSSDNAWPRGEQTSYSIPFLDPFIIILGISLLVLGLGVWVYVKIRKRNKDKKGA